MDQEDWGDSSQVRDIDFDGALAALENGARPNFGSETEFEQRREIIRRLTRLEELLSAGLPTHGAIGHNQPPEEADSVISNAIDASTNLRRELGKRIPSTTEIAGTTRILRNCLQWLRRRVENLAESALGTAVIAAVVDPQQAIEVLSNVLDALDIWFTLIL